MLLAPVLSVPALFPHPLLHLLVAALVLLIVVITLHTRAFLLAKKRTDVTSELQCLQEKAVNCMLIKGWSTVVLTRRLLYIEELAIHVLR